MPKAIKGNAGRKPPEPSPSHSDVDDWTQRQRWIIEMAAYDVSVNIVFLGGADFTSPPPLGTTDRTRYVKVSSLEEAQRPELHKWIEQAGRTPGWT
jgi:hypothetical protein